MNYPLISVILPTFNRADLLSGAVNSALNQSYSHFELIIWNDGSSDNSDEVVHSFQDPRIRYFFDHNHGKSFALNQSIQRSEGDYVAFLDDDDRWLPGKLNLQMQLFKDKPELDLVFGNFRNIDLVNGREGIGFDQNAIGLRELSTTKISENTYFIAGGFLKGLARSNFIAFDTVMIKRSFLDEIGVFNEDLKRAEDFEFWWRFGLAGGKVGYVENMVMNRFKHANSLSSQSLESIDNYVKSLDTCAELSIIKQKNDTVKYLLPAYRNAFQNKIIICGTLSQKKNAWLAYQESLKYGFRPGSLKLLIQAIV